MTLFLFLRILNRRPCRCRCRQKVTLYVTLPFDLFRQLSANLFEFVGLFHRNKLCEKRRNPVTHTPKNKSFKAKLKGKKKEVSNVRYECTDDKQTIKQGLNRLWY